MDPKIRYNTSKEHINTMLTIKYLTPIEKSFTLDNVLNWFSNENIDYIGSLPDCDLEGSYIGIENMNGNKGSFLNRFMSQIGMIFTSYGADGVFLVIGKKKI